MPDRQKFTASFDVQNAVAAAKQLTAAFNEQSTAIGRMTTSVKNYNKSQNSLVKGTSAVGNKVQTMAEKSKKAADATEILGKKSKKAGDEMAAGANKAGLAWGNLTTKLLAAQAITTAVSTMKRVVRESTKAFIDLQVAIANVQTISLDTFGSLGNKTRGLVKDITAVSNAFGVSQVDVAKAQYQALSNQISGAANSLNFVTSAARLAVIGQGSLQEATNLLSSALNAFNLSTARADQLTAKFYRTIELGRITLPELAADFGRIAALSEVVGVNIDELLASLSSITRQGISFAKTQTLMINVLLRMIKPTEALTDLIQEWGYASTESAIAGEGLLGFFERLGKEVRKSPDALKEIGELLGSIRGVTGGALLLGETEGLADDIAKIIDSSARADEAFRRAMENMGVTLNREGTQIKNFFTVEVGGAITEFIFGLDEATRGIGGISTVITGILIPGLAAGAIAWTAFWLATTGPIGWVAGSFAALAIGVSALVGVVTLGLTDWGGGVEELQKQIDETFAAIRKDAVKTTDILKETVGKYYNKLLKESADKIKKLTEEYGDNELQFDLLVDSIEDGGERIEQSFVFIDNSLKNLSAEFENSKADISAWSASFVKDLDSIDKETDTVYDNINSFLDKISDFRQDVAMEGMSPGQQVDALLGQYKGQRNAGDVQGAFETLKKLKSTIEGMNPNNQALQQLYGGIDYEASLLGRMAQQIGVDTWNAEGRADAEAAMVQARDTLNEFLEMQNYAATQVRNVPTEGLGGLSAIFGQGEGIARQASILMAQYNAGQISGQEFAEGMRGNAEAFKEFSSTAETEVKRVTKAFADLKDAQVASNKTLKNGLKEMKELFKEGFDPESIEGKIEYTDVISDLRSEMANIRQLTGISESEQAKGFITSQLAELQARGATLAGITPAAGQEEALQGKIDANNTLQGILQNQLMSLTEYSTIEETVIPLVEREFEYISKITKEREKQAGLLIQQKDILASLESSLEAQNVINDANQNIQKTLIQGDAELLASQRGLRAQGLGMSPVAYDTGPESAQGKLNLAKELISSLRTAITEGNVIALAQIRESLVTTGALGLDENTLASLSTQLEQFITALTEQQASGGTVDDIISANQEVFAGLAEQNNTNTEGLIALINEGKLSLQSPTEQTATNTATTVTLLRGILGAVGGGIAAASRGGAFATGGSVDSIPAMLAPGEFVMRSRAAQAIGMGNLSHMNNLGRIPGKSRGGTVIQGFADGGPVGGTSNNTFNIQSTGNHQVDARRLSGMIDRERNRGTIAAAGKRRRPY